MKLTGESIMDNYSENSFLISGNSSINSSKHQTALTMYTQGEHNISSSTQILPDISPPVKIPQNNETLEIDHEDEFANDNFCTKTYNFHNYPIPQNIALATPVLIKIHLQLIIVEGYFLKMFLKKMTLCQYPRPQTFQC